VSRAGEATLAPPTANPPRLDVFLAAMEDRRPIPVGARSRVLCHRRMSLPGPTAALL
jgi:hypothetical protein